MLLLPNVAVGAIHLELRPNAASVEVGQTVEVGLYAVSDDETEQPIGGIDALLEWDPNVLTLLGRTNNGPYPWMLSWFPDDGDLDDLNGTWLDGNALYQCLRRNNPDPPAFATPSGLLVTTFRFSSHSARGWTPIALAERLGVYSSTRVLDGFDSSVVTGTLVPASVSVFLCGAAADFDDDCDVDGDDLAWLAGCITGPGTGGSPSGCGAADWDLDGDVDLLDAARFLESYTGG